MNRKIKRIIVMSLILTTTLAVLPTNYLKLINTNVAYADDDDDDEKEAKENSYLDDIDISQGTLNFKEKKADYTVKIDSGISEIVITAKAKNSTDKIKIGGGDYVSLDSNNRAEKTVKLEKGRNMIKVKVETEAYGIRTYNLIINRGSASSDANSDNSDDLYLQNIVLSDGDISFSEEKNSYDIKVNSSVDEIRITAQPEKDNYEVKIDGIKVTKDEKFKRTVKLLDGNNIVLIHVKGNDGGENTYTLNINRGGTSELDTSEVIDNNQDPIYLDNIVIQNGSVPIEFKRKVTCYAIDVKDTIDNVLVKAEPESDSIVRINGSTCNRVYIKRIPLKEGKNIVTIKVNNGNTYNKSDKEYKERIYTLTIYRGTSEGKSQDNKVTIEQQSNSKISNDETNEIKSNQWVKINDNWQYNDATGKSLKNTWYYDKNYQNNYYFKEDANMALGWILYQNNWYYFGSDGAMKTGWIKDFDGKWYYLYSTGVMAVNTIINGYKIGLNGAWIN